MISSWYLTFWRTIGSIKEIRSVSKPNLLSRLRYVTIASRVDETNEERLYRLEYDKLQEWNNQYWSLNNEIFKRDKQEYIKKKFGDTISDEEALSHDQLALFYKNFLDKNRQKHIEYNKTWYRNYVRLLLFSMRAKVSRMKTQLIE